MVTNISNGESVIFLNFTSFLKVDLTTTTANPKHIMTEEVINQEIIKGKTIIETKEIKILTENNKTESTQIIKGKKNMIQNMENIIMMIMMMMNNLVI